MIDRIKSVVVGHAVADALGVPVEVGVLGSVGVHPTAKKGSANNANK